MSDYKVVVGGIDGTNNKYIELRDEDGAFECGTVSTQPEPNYRSTRSVEDKCLYYSLEYIQQLELRLHRINLFAVEWDKNGLLDYKDIIELSEV